MIKLSMRTRDTPTPSDFAASSLSRVARSERPNRERRSAIEISTQIAASTDNQVHPFYFRPSPQDGLPAPSSTAIIRPEEFRHLALPKDWGSWDDAVEV